MGIKFYQEDIVQKARNLKKKGSTAAKIAKDLNVGDTTILRWCTDIPSNNPYHLYAQKLRDRAKEKSIKLGENIGLSEKKQKF